MQQDRRLEFGTSHWRDCAGVSKEELRSLANEYGLSADMVADCLDPSHLPKIERSPNLSFLILRAYDESAADDGTTVQELTRKVAIFAGENFVLSVHRVPLPWINQLWSDWERKPNRDRSQMGAVMSDLVEECIYTFEAPIDRASLAIDKLEDNIFHQGHHPVTSNEILQDAYIAKKRATLYKRMLRLTRDLVPSVSKVGDPLSPAIQNLKEEADRLYFYSDDLVETSNDLVQLSISLSSNRTNEVVRVLTLVSIFLLPLTLITGVYGMNFHFMPELEWAFGYPFVLALMAGVEWLIYVVLKKRGWIRTGYRRHQ
jgi:magnesium transporter